MGGQLPRNTNPGSAYFQDQGILSVHDFHARARADPQTSQPRDLTGIPVDSMDPADLTP